MISIAFVNPAARGRGAAEALLPRFPHLFSRIAVPAFTMVIR
jgi:hypothetical protein